MPLSLAAEYRYSLKKLRIVPPLWVRRDPGTRRRRPKPDIDGRHREFLMKRSTSRRPLRGLFRVLSLLVLGAYLAAIVQTWSETLNDTRVVLSHVDSMMVQSVRTTLKEHEFVIRGLGSELVALGALEHPENGRALIERMKSIDPGMVGFGLARPDGQLVLVSGVEKGRSLPNLSQQAASRDSFQQALREKHLTPGRPYYFDELHGWVVPIRVALRDAAGKVTAVMIAGYAIEGATTAWTHMELPPAVQIALMRDDGYLIYRQPLPPGPHARALQRTYGRPVAAQTRAQVAALRGNGSFVEMTLPQAGYQYVAYRYIPKYGLHAAAFVSRAVVLRDWLQRLLMPTALLLVVLAGGALAYRRARQQQARSDREVGQLTAWQQALLDGAEYSIISTDRNGLIVSYNKAAQRILGYTPEEVVGKATPELFHDPEELARRAEELSAELGRPVAPGLEAAILRPREGGAEERHWTHIRKDGTRIPVRLAVTALKDADGDLVGFLGIAADLSEQQAMRADLRDSEARYRGLFEGAGDAIFLIRGERVVDCNPASLGMFRCSRRQLLGETLHRYSPDVQPDGRPSREIAAERIAAACRGESQFLEWRSLRHDGSAFDAEVTLNAVAISGEPHLLLTVRDISARKQNESELARSRQMLIERNESLRLINRVSQRLHGTRQVEEILHETIAALLGLSRAPQVAIYLLQPEGRELRLAASHGFDQPMEQLGSSLPVAGSLSGLALSGGRTLASADLEHDERLEPAIRAALVARGAISMIAIPMLHQSQALGTLNLVYRERHDFSAIEQETLSSLGNTVALAIANARHMDDLEFQTRHDGLTGLPNRTLLHETFRHYLEASGAEAARAALLLLDLDRFKEINDTLGHHVGDKVLTQIGPRLEQTLAGRSALHARLGGDEFAILLTGEAAADAEALAEAATEAMRGPFQTEGIEVSIGASIGVSRYPEHGRDSHALLRAADVAMYQAKRLSVGVKLYDPGLDGHSKERLAMAAELAQAAELGQLLLYYQPKVDLASRRAVGFEALVRWQHPRLGLLGAGSFIDLVEMSEVIHPFTRAVMEMAVADKRQLHELGFEQPVAINLSARNLLDASCYTSLAAAIERHGLPPEEIELELTETALMQDPESAAELLQRFTRAGIKIAIDDFGTGYSSLGYLRQLPIYALKIDRSFIKDMRSNQHDELIVRSTIGLAHNLDLKVVAEGVEDTETLDLLQEMGCDEAQGFYLCKPQPLAQLIDWIKGQAADDGE